MEDFLNIVLNIFTTGLPCCLLALGIFLTYRLLDFADLTAEGSFLLGAAICGVMIYNGYNPWLATICGLLIGFVAGAITGVLNRYLKIPKLLSGIITMIAASSIALLIFGLQNGSTSAFKDQISFSPKYGGEQQTIFSLLYPWELSTKTNTYIVPGFHVKELIAIAMMFGVVGVVMLAIYFFFGTQYGMAIRATGMNESMARAQGINTNIATIVCIAIANGLIGLAGALYVQSSSSVTVTSAQGFLVVGLASIIIGETIFGKRSFKNWLISVALGAIFYYIIINIAIRLGLPTQLMSLLYAVLIVVALLLGSFKEKIRKRRIEWMNNHQMRKRKKIEEEGNKDA